MNFIWSVFFRLHSEYENVRALTSIFSCPVSKLEVFSIPEAYSEPIQTSKTELFAKIVNNFQEILGKSQNWVEALASVQSLFQK